MSFVRTLAGAIIGLIVAPRGAMGRRQALASLWACVRGGGEVSAFAGTPCSAEGDEVASRPASPRGSDAEEKGG